MSKIKRSYIPLHYKEWWEKKYEGNINRIVKISVFLQQLIINNY